MHGLRKLLRVMWGMVDDRNKYVRCLKKRLIGLRLKKEGIN